MIKSLIKGIMIGMGIIIGAYLLSIVPISFIQHPIQEFCQSIGEMLLKIAK